MTINVFISNMMDNERLLEVTDFLNNVINSTSFYNYSFRSCRATDFIEPPTDRRLEGIAKSEIFILLLSNTISNYQESEYLFAKQRSLKTIAFLEIGIERDPKLLNFMKSSGLQFMEFLNIEDLKDKLSQFLKTFSYYKSESGEIKEIPTIDNPSEKLIALDTPDIEWVKIGIVQIDFTVGDEFPFQNLSINNEYLEKICNFLEIAEEMELDILLFPELSVNERILTEIENYSSEMIIIAGSYYKNNSNISPIFINKIAYEIKKMHPSKFEDSPLAGKNMVHGKNPITFETSKGRFSVLICDDFRHHGNDIQKNVEMIFVPSYNPKPSNFSNRASILVEDHHKYVFISNSSKFGCSGIYGILDRDYLDELKKQGLIPKKAPTYELCSLKQGMEAIIVACFNLKRTSVEVPTKVLHYYANVREIKVLDENNEEITEIWTH